MTASSALAWVSAPRARSTASASLHESVFERSCDSRRLALVHWVSARRCRMRYIGGTHMGLGALRSHGVQRRALALVRRLGIRSHGVLALECTALPQLRLRARSYQVRPQCIRGTPSRLGMAQLEGSWRSISPTARPRRGISPVFIVLPFKAYRENRVYLAVMFVLVLFILRSGFVHVLFVLVRCVCTCCSRLFTVCSFLFTFVHFCSLLFTFVHFCSLLEQ